jgi:hypothetical protein
VVKRGLEPLEQSHRALLLSLPPSDAERVSSLPRLLGVSSRSRGGFDDYAKLEVIVDLPRFAGERCRVPQAELSQARYAHHVGGFWGLTADRILDGQTAAPPDVLAPLERAWSVALSAACGLDAVAAARKVRAAARRLDRGVERERALCDFPGWVDAVIERTWWFALVAAELVRRHRGARAQAAFRRAVTVLMLSLQCLDDAADVEEDRVRTGASVPEKLEVSPESLELLSAHFAALASTAAASAGFEQLGDWCRARAEEVQGGVRASCFAAARLEALGLLAQLEASGG